MKWQQCCTVQLELQNSAAPTDVDSVASLGLIGMQLHSSKRKFPLEDEEEDRRGLGEGRQLYKHNESS